MSTAATTTAGVRSARADRPALVARLAGELLDDLPDLLDRLLRRVREEEPAYQVVPDAALRRSLNDNVAHVLRALARGCPALQDPPRRTARERADAGVPLSAVLHAYRLGFREVWDSLVDRVRLDPDAPLEELVQGVADVWEMVEAYSEVATTEYSVHLDLLARRDEQQRMRRLEELVDGRATDWSVHGGTARVLGLPQEGPYLVVFSDPDALPDVEQHLRRNGVSSVWMPVRDGQLGVVGATNSGPVVARALLGQIALGRVGVSPPLAHLREVPTAAGRATTARSCLPAGEPEVCSIDDRPLAAVLASAPEIARRAMRTVLGGLLGTAEPERAALLQTLECWFAAGGSNTAAAEALHCHRNTVRNRINRVTELTGRRLEDPRDASLLHAALVAHALLGPAPSHRDDQEAPASTGLGTVHSPVG